MVVVAVLGLTFAADAGASGHGRRAVRNGVTSAEYQHDHQNPLARLPDSALSMPPNLRMTPFQSGPRNAMSAGLAVAPATPLVGLGTIRHDSMAGSVRQSYNRFCDNVSARLWANPNGRRVSFDVHGKPGVAVEIPLR
jgi:hypothetical protein